MKKLFTSEKFQVGLAIAIDAVGEFLKIVGLAAIFCFIALQLPPTEE